MPGLQLLVILAVLALLYVVGQAWARNALPRKSEPLGPHAMFDGGERYATADERLNVEHDGPGGAGEGVLRALVEALRVRGFATYPVEPESYGFMTVVGIAGEDIVLTLAAGGDQDWVLFVKAPSGKVPIEIMNALRSLDVRNVTWSV